MNFFISAGATIVALGLLITFHEFGHFWVARRCGVKVLRFSIGFGKALWRHVGKDGTEYVVALLPLGGYVKMLDEREAEVPKDQLHLAFNRKNVWQRIAIVVAGPLANFILAAILFWLMFVIGVRTLVPIVTSTEPNTPAAVVNLPKDFEITKVDGSPVASWYDVSLRLLKRLGDSGNLVLSGKPFAVGDESEQQYQLPVTDWLVGVDQPDPIALLGLVPWQPVIEPVIGSLRDNGAAITAGLQLGDRIVSVDGETIKSWMQWVKVIRENPGKQLQVGLQRQGVFLQIILTPSTRELEKDLKIGFIGAGAKITPLPVQRLRTVHYSVLGSVGKSLEHTWFMGKLTLDSIGKMLTGLLSVKNLSGPISIAKIAGDSAKLGIESFINFLAMLSISLGVLNLLPIPVLDGGHLLFYMIEAISGRPLPERIQSLSFRLGVGIVLTVMCIALYNDLIKL